MDNLKKNLANLLKVKTIVTLILTVVFGIMAMRKDISSENFMTIFSVIIAFYFATQSEKNGHDEGGAHA